MDTSLAITFLRVVAGLGLMTHGVPKLKNLAGTTAWMKGEGIPAPRASALFAGVTETFGGLLVALGIFTPYVAAVVALNLLGALTYHLFKRQAFKAMEDAVLYLALFIFFALVGGGAYQLI